MEDNLGGLLDDPNLGIAVSPDDLFSMLETLESSNNPELLIPPLSPLNQEAAVLFTPTRIASQNSASSSAFQDSETEAEPSPSCKRQKVSASTAPSSDQELVTGADGQQRMMHITVERNRRKQMNEHLSVLRTLMPCFYVKRGDQASIIGGVVDYIKELQQVLQSLEAKKQRKVYSEVLSPRLNSSVSSSSPRPSPLSPRKPPLSPRVSLPISPRTPQPSSPYKPRMQHGFMSPTISAASVHEPSNNSSSNSCNSSFDSTNNIVMELVANSKSSIADVEVKLSGPNVLLKTVSPRIPGQAFKIISALEGLALEILHVSISTIDETMLNSFTIKIGLECKLSAEELAHEVQQTFR